MDVLLVNPYFNEELDRSIFRYPPLGLGYLASTLREAGFSVDIIDCTFSRIDDVLRRIRKIGPCILGIYSMVTINHHAIRIAEEIKADVDLLVAGGPLPTLVPHDFLDLFDAVVLHEGEQTLLELTRNHFNGNSWEKTAGIAYNGNNGRVNLTEPRAFQEDLDSIPYPARDLFPNRAYKKYWKKYHGYTATSMMTTRGCPYLCDFCSNPVFGQSYRQRSAENVFEEMEQIKELGYDRVFFQDDCFTQNPKRTDRLCDILIAEGVDLDWMCLSRADALTKTRAKKMAEAGCKRIFFGIESGDPRMLKILNKRIVPEDARSAVNAASAAGITTGGFFILGYPGETNDSLLRTIRFSSSLGLDYMSYSFPYPIYGTGLYTKVRSKITEPEWRKQRGKAGKHQLLFQGDFSETKLRIAKNKGMIQHYLRRDGGLIGRAAAHVFEQITDRIIPHLR